MKNFVSWKIFPVGKRPQKFDVRKTFPNWKNRLKFDLSNRIN